MLNRSKMPVAASLALVLLAVVSGESAMSLEKPDYEVVFKAGDIEYRQYSPYLVAETVITDRDDYKAAGNEGFRRLFRYITGNNRSQQDIAMTAPTERSTPLVAMTSVIPIARMTPMDPRLRTSTRLP